MPSDLLISALLICLGTALSIFIIAVFCRAILSSFNKNSSGSFNFSFSRIPARLYLSKKRAALLKVDKITPSIQTLPSIFECFRAALGTDKVILDDELLSEVNAHHDTLVSKLITVGEALQTHLELLPELEELFSTYHDLSKELLEHTRTADEVIKKQKDKGREAPTWATQEFQKKEVLLKERIDATRRAIDRTLRDIMTSLKRKPSADSITYH